MMVTRQRSQGVLGVWGFGQHSVRVLEEWLEQSWGSGRGSILDQMGSQQSDGDLDNLTLQ